MTAFCIRYLNSGCFDSWVLEKLPNGSTSRDGILNARSQRQLMVRFHFLQYASQNLLYHASKSDSLDSQLLSQYDAFFLLGSHDFESWKEFLHSGDDTTNLGASYPIHVAAKAGLTSYMSHLLSSGVDPDLVDSAKRSPLTSRILRYI
jgi:hypothetical protein